MPSDIYTPQAVYSYVFTSNLRASVTAIFGFSCIFAILRYSAKSMESGYRFHLLNMAVWILMSDLVILILCRPYPILPVNGGCFVGELNQFLLSRMPVKTANYVQIMICGYFIIASMATVCNATIHKYLFVSELVGKNEFKFKKIHIYLFMFFIQVLWPLIGGLLLMKIDWQPTVLLEESKNLYPEIYQRTVGQPCILFVAGIVDLAVYYLPAGSIALLQVVFCGFVTLFLLAKCWYKILNTQIGTVSKRTLKMQRQLLISLSVQSCLPYLIFLIGGGTFVFGFLFEIQFLEAVTNQVFLYVSLHSVINCLTVFGTIPTYYKGLLKDVKYLCSCGRYRSSETTVVTNVSFANSTTRIVPINVPVFVKTGFDFLLK